MPQPRLHHRQPRSLRCQGVSVEPQARGLARRCHHRRHAHVTSSYLRARQRDQRVGHAGRGRQGEGAARRRQAGHRLRRGRGADFPTPGYIAEAAARACLDPKNHKYTATGGLPELREAIAAKTARDSAYQVTPGQVIVTNGAKHAVYQTFATLVDPGDEVLLPTPHWTTYPEWITLAGGIPVPVYTDERSGYLTSVADLEAARTERTKVLLFVSPSNPTGAVYPPELVAEIGRWAAASGLWVVTDEIYEHLVYGDARFVSMPAVVPEIADHCVVLNGVAKTYAMTAGGWAG